MKLLDINLTKIVLAMYLIIGNSYTKELYSGQVHEFIKSNRLAQHFIAFTTVLVLISMVHSDVQNWLEIVAYTVTTYLWFILTTKLDVHWNIVIFLLLVAGYFYDLKVTNKERCAESDQALNKTDIKKIRRVRKNVRGVVALSIVAVTVIGTFLYMNKQKVQHGGNFDYTTYLLY